MTFAVNVEKICRFLPYRVEILWSRIQVVPLCDDSVDFLHRDVRPRAEKMQKWVRVLLVGVRWAVLVGWTPTSQVNFSGVDNVEFMDQRFLDKFKLTIEVNKENN